MAYMTKYGSFWGAVPVHRGRVFWVAPSASYYIEGRSYSADDGQPGDSPERAVVTVNQALSYCTDGAGDVIVLLPGAHTVSTALTMSKSDVHLTGLQTSNFLRPCASLTQSTAATTIMTVSAADVEICNLRIIPITAATAITWTTGAHRLYIHDCSFDMATPAANVATIGAGHAGTTYTSAPANVLISHNYFEVTGAQGPALKMGDAKDFIVEKNVIAFKGGTWANATLQGGVLGWGIYRDNELHALKDSTITAGITGTDLTSTLSVAIYRNFFSGTNSKPIEDWGATDATIAENYKTEVGAAAGGVLWSSIT